MKCNKAFTLVEMVISITLMGLVLFLVYESIDNITLSNKIIKDTQNTQAYKNRRISLLKEDLINSTDINVSTSDDYSVIQFETQNSIHGIIQPFVVWLVAKKDNTLVRLESAQNILLPLEYSLEHKPYLDVMIANVERFKIYTSKEKDYILVEIKDGKSHKFFELFKPQGRL